MMQPFSRTGSHNKLGIIVKPTSDEMIIIISCLLCSASLLRTKAFLEAALSDPGQTNLCRSPTPQREITSPQKILVAEDPFGICSSVHMLHHPSNIWNGGTTFGQVVGAASMTMLRQVVEDNSALHKKLKAMDEARYYGARPSLCVCVCFFATW